MRFRTCGRRSDRAPSVDWRPCAWASLVSWFRLLHRPDRSRKTALCSWMKFCTTSAFPPYWSFHRHRRRSCRNNPQALSPLRQSYCLSQVIQEYPSNSLLWNESEGRTAVHNPVSFGIWRSDIFLLSPPVHLP